MYESQKAYRGLPLHTTTALAIVDSNLDPLSLCVIVTAV